MNVKDNRRVKMTKQLIKNALIDLMEKKPINKITVKEICECADINRSTFYLHYVDQYALLEEIENDIINMTPRINLYYDVQIYPLLVEFFEFIQENKRLYMVLFKNSSGNSFTNKVLDKVFGKDDKKPVWISNMSLKNELHFKMLMVALGATALIEKWIFDEIKSTPQELAETLAKFINN